MAVVIVVGVVVTIVLAGTYAVWRVKYGPPRAGAPQVLCFHKIADRFCWEGTWTTPDRFFATIDRLLERGYRFLDESQYLTAIESADGPSRDALFLTFDDGYRELHTVVLPGLAARAVPFHVFLVSEYAGRDNTWDLSLGRRPFRHLSWDEVAEMGARGVTFGSHGATHADLTRLALESVRSELVRSKTEIECRLKRPVRTLSYPFGRYREEVKRAARDAGYEAAFSLYPSHANARFDRYAIRRNAVYIVDPVRLVEAKLAGSRLYWCEEMKCRAINAVAVLTPILRNAGDRKARGS